VIKPQQAVSFLESLPVSKFYGVGKVTADKMHRLGIVYGRDLKAWSKYDLTKSFGKAGAFYYDMVRGDDNRPVQADRVRKSVAVERTLDENLSDLDDIHEFVERIAISLHKSITKSSFKAKTLALKIKNKDFIIKTRSITSKQYITEFDEISSLAHKLVDDNKDICVELRLIGLTLSNIDAEDVPRGGEQLELGL
jgi:DNA polymerase IV